MSPDAAAFEVAGCRVMDGMVMAPALKRRQDEQPEHAPESRFARLDGSSEPCAQS